MQIIYDDLSDDPEVAFAEVIEQLDAQIGPFLEQADHQSDTRPIMLDYMNNAIAAAGALGIDEFAHWLLPDYREAYSEYNTFSLAVKQFVIRTRISKTRISKIYSVELDDTSKRKIHHLISQIRELIAQTPDLTEGKKNSLFAKLNSFAADVDRIRTRFENAMLALSAVADVAKKGAESVKPLTELVNSITALIGEVKSHEPEPPKLPAPKEPKRLEGPETKKTVPPKTELDDDIPF